MDIFAIILSCVGIIFSVLGLIFSIIFLIKTFKLDKIINKVEIISKDLEDFQEYLCLENDAEYEQIKSTMSLYKCSKARALLILYKEEDRIEKGKKG